MNGPPWEMPMYGPKRMEGEMSHPHKRKLTRTEAEALYRADIVWPEHERGHKPPAKPPPDPLLARLEARIAELEAKDKRGDEIIEKYRELHVKQHQRIHELESMLKDVVLQPRKEEPK